MEFEEVSEEVEWEARRIAVAFEITEPDIEGWNGLFASVQGACGGEESLGMAAYLFADQSTFVFTGRRETSLIVKGNAITEINGLANHPNDLAIPLEPILRAFYRLGYDGSLLENQAQCHPLSSHEKLELRLSMPREFWPQKWRDEEESLST